MGRTSPKNLPPCTRHPRPFVHSPRADAPKKTTFSLGVRGLAEKGFTPCVKRRLGETSPPILARLRPRPSPHPGPRTLGSPPRPARDGTSGTEAREPPSPGSRKRPLAAADRDGPHAPPPQRSGGGRGPERFGADGRAGSPGARAPAELPRGTAPRGARGGSGPPSPDQGVEQETTIDQRDGLATLPQRCRWSDLQC